MATGPDATDFSILAFIAQGCYSNVYKVEKLTGPDRGKQYAMKRIYFKSWSAMDYAVREREIYERLSNQSSPFLASLAYAFYGKQTPCLILQLGSGFTLETLMSSVQRMNAIEARFYLVEIICALETLHSLNIVYLDLKPSNIQLHENGHIFLSDFDRSVCLPRRYNNTAASHFCGTPMYVAPEVWNHVAVDRRADIWSLGVVAVEMVLGGKRPGTSEQMRKRARAGFVHLDGLDQRLPTFQRFIRLCLVKNYKDRPCLNTVKHEAYFQRVEWAAVGSPALAPPFKLSAISTEFTLKRMTLKSIESHIREAFHPLTLEGHEILHAFRLQSKAIDAKFDRYAYVAPGLRGVDRELVDNIPAQDSLATSETHGQPSHNEVGTDHMDIELSSG